MQAYVRAIVAGRWPTRICTQVVFPGGWTCSTTSAVERHQSGGLLGGCERSNASFDVYKASRPSRTPTSGPVLWKALGGKVLCGLALGPPNTLLCGARPVPPPKAQGEGDPHFVYLKPVGRPLLVRLSQKSWVGTITKAVTLTGASKWYIRASGVTCTIGATAVRCANRSHYGFTITKSSYRAF
jgi:hypothetical protein